MIVYVTYTPANHQIQQRQLHKAEESPLVDFVRYRSRICGCRHRRRRFPLISFVVIIPIISTRRTVALFDVVVQIRERRRRGCHDKRVLHLIVIVIIAVGGLIKAGLNHHDICSNFASTIPRQCCHHWLAMGQ
jgi:hypothetical protein